MGFFGGLVKYVMLGFFCLRFFCCDSLGRSVQVQVFRLCLPSVGDQACSRVGMRCWYGVDLGGYVPAVDPPAVGADVSVGTRRGMREKLCFLGLES